MLVLSSMLFILAVIIGLFIGCVHPLLGIFDCAMSKRSAGGKLMWIVATLLFGPLVSLTYAFAGGSSEWLRRTSWYAIQAGIGGLLLSMLLVFMSPEAPLQAELSADDAFDALAGAIDFDPAAESAASGEFDENESSEVSPERFVSTSMDSEQEPVFADSTFSALEVESSPFNGEESAGDFSTEETADEWESEAPAEPAMETIAEGLPAAGQWFDWLQQVVAQADAQTESVESLVETSAAQVPTDAGRATSKPATVRNPVKSEPRAAAPAPHLTNSEPQPNKTREQKRAFNRYTNSFEQRDASAKPARRPVINRYLEQ